jgi:hypothetical protein
MTDAQVADLVAHLAEATSGTAVEVSAGSVAAARREKGSILKALDE